jgi:non-canonical purine NTP pyrophosphatase (RdgB/HAM1 family)
MKLYFITGNDKKAREVALIFPEVESIRLDLPEIQSLDAKEVIMEKLKIAHQIAPDKVLVVEDVSYSIAGLNGLPGTLIKWFVKSIGVDGVYDIVKDRDTATIVSANIGLVKPSGEMIFATGEVSGRTVSPGIGEGFHFDNIFVPDGGTKRYSEMEIEEKNKISHRFKAWTALKEELAKSIG